ncbi:hypothetical protein AGMMS49975_09560 [Clostridia bacterium]|nr:hypothetical protein AGMMS49975_09560 [Clostridia bacterium]
MLKHKVCINVCGKDGSKSSVLCGGQRTIRSRLLNFLLGGEVGVFVLTPGRSVETVEIRETPQKGDGKK